MHDERYDTKTQEYSPKSNTIPAFKRDTKYDATIKTK